MGKAYVDELVQKKRCLGDLKTKAAEHGWLKSESNFFNPFSCVLQCE